MDGVTVHPVDDAAVLFDRHRQTVFTANPSAATIWQGLAAGLAPSEIAETLASHAPVDEEAARRHVARTLRQWRRARREPAPDYFSPAATAVSEGPLRSRPAEESAAKILHYRLLDTAFTLHVSGDVPLASTEVVLRHLEAEPTPWLRKRALEIRATPTGFAASEEDRVLYRCSSAAEIPALIKAALTDCALDCEDGLAALHAAALYRRESCLLLPGVSGSGKSCLAAALAGRGFTLLGDDAVVLRRSDLRLRPLPYGICIKDPAPAPLEAQFSELSRLPLCARPDGKKVRYLTPPAIETAAAEAAVTPNQIVFPQYRPDDETVLHAISTEAAIKRLLASYTPLGTEMTPQDVDRLVAWISGRQCYALQVSSLAEAANLLERFDR